MHSKCLLKFHTEKKLAVFLGMGTGRVLQIWVFSILSFITIFCNCNDSMTMNKILKQGELLISQDKSFALGFFSPNTNSKRTYVGIWFYKVSLQTMVWVANRNNPINGNVSGFLSINKSGDLALYGGGSSDLVWSTNVSSDAADTESTQAQLLDSGNLILIDSTNGRILWQSFDHPTNTLLPGMKIGINRILAMNWFLTSWRSGDDPGIGDYSYRLNISGWPQFYLFNGLKHYFRTCPCQWRSGFFYFNYSLVQNKDETYGTFSAHASVVSRIVLDDSGILKWLVWIEKHNQWKELWSYPNDRCDRYGKCGANSNCDANFPNKFECKCLPGYEPKSPKDWLSRDASDGCIRKRLNSSSVCRHGEGFVKLEALKIPDFSVETWVNLSKSGLECERQFKSDCSCSAYSSINGSICLYWYGDLVDTRSYIGAIGYDLYIRVDALELAEGARGSNSIFENKGILSVIILSAASAWCFLVIILIYFFRRNQKRKRAMKRKGNKRLSNTKNLTYNDDTLELEGGNRTHPDLVLSDVNTILFATDNFSPSNKIGQGGFGAVYKGQLADGKEIAVKKECSKVQSKELKSLKMKLH